PSCARCAGTTPLHVTSRHCRHAPTCDFPGVEWYRVAWGPGRGACQAQGRRFDPGHPLSVSRKVAPFRGPVLTHDTRSGPILAVLVGNELATDQKQLRALYRSLTAQQTLLDQGEGLVVYEPQLRVILDEVTRLQALDPTLVPTVSDDRRE